MFQGALDAALHIDADTPQQLIESINRAAGLGRDILDRRLGRITRQEQFTPLSGQTIHTHLQRRHLARPQRRFAGTFISELGDYGLVEHEPVAGPVAVKT